MLPFCTLFCYLQEMKFPLSYTHKILFQSIYKRKKEGLIMTSRNTIHKTQTIAIYVRSGITAFWKKKILPSKNDNESTPKTSFTDYKADISPTPTEKRKAKNTIGKRTIIKVFKWLLMFLISSFLGGYIGHASEPIYNSIDAIFSQKHLILSAVSYGSSSIQNL